MDIGYFQAWAMWARGEDLRAATLWGLQIFWWARLSKVLGLIAALTIAVKIVGVERLKRFAAGFDTAGVWNASRSASKKVFTNIFSIYTNIIEAMDDDSNTEPIWKLLGNIYGFTIMILII
ncbi:MAG: hypothetical protein AAFO89_03310 [Planctomycetota bacterium]